MLVVAAVGVALVEAAPVGPVLDVADGAQRRGEWGPARGDDQAVEQAADLGSGQCVLRGQAGPWARRLRVVVSPTACKQAATKRA